jgi:hypothetical protein
MALWQLGRSVFVCTHSAVIKRAIATPTSNISQSADEIGRRGGITLESSHSNLVLSALFFPVINFPPTKRRKLK